MSFLFVDQGEHILADLLIAENLSLHLYKNDKTPADSDTEANYTEANFTGYSSVPMDESSWTVTPGAPTELEYPEQSFTSTADQTAQTIYGYYILLGTSLICAWRFDDGPYTVSKNGDEIKITPNILFKKPSEA